MCNNNLQNKIRLMSHKKSHSNIFVITIKGRTANEFSDSYGNITPAGTSFEQKLVVNSMRAAFDALNTFFGIEDYIIDNVSYEEGLNIVFL